MRVITAGSEMIIATALSTNSCQVASICGFSLLRNEDCHPNCPCPCHLHPVHVHCQECATMRHGGHHIWHWHFCGCSGQCMDSSHYEQRSGVPTLDGTFDLPPPPPQLWQIYGVLLCRGHRKRHCQSWACTRSALPDQKTV